MYSKLLHYQTNFINIIPQYVTDHSHYSFSEEQFTDLLKLLEQITEDPEVSSEETKEFWKKANSFLRSQHYIQWSQTLLRMNTCPQILKDTFPH